MEEDFALQEAVLTLKPIEDRLDSVDLERSVVYRNNSIESSSKLNTIEVEAFLDDDYGSDGISKQIIVQRIDDFIVEGQGKGLNDSLHVHEYSSETENITIVPDALNDADGITQIIADHNAENEDVGTTYFPDNYIPVMSNIQKRVKSRSEVYHKKNNKMYIKEETDEAENYDVKLQEPLPSLKKIPKSKNAAFFRRKEPIKIDKNDPRSRLHFVKYMKKEGKIIKLWECGICEKEFVHQYTLTRHLPTHTDERNYKCKVCGKAFRQMSTLAQHKATHSEFRPYVCEICQKTFSRVSTLISHKKIHNDNKPHICYICGKGFHQKGNLKNHFYTHTNERPYKCDICGRGFNQASNLQCHKLKTHLQKGNSPQLVNSKYKCLHCSESFSRRAQLRHHEEYVHKIKNVFSSKNSLRPNLIPSRSPLLKKKKLGNIRIIQMTPDDDDDKEDGNETDSNFNSRMGILIDPIDTKAMHKALSKGNVPFALLKPCRSSPVVVRVKLCDGSKHMLVPATASELKAAGKFYISSEQDGNRTVQIKVPVVATIHQRVDENGQLHMDVEPPSDEESDKPEDSLVKTATIPLDDQPSTSENRTPADVDANKNPSIIQVQHFILNPAFGKNLVPRGENFEEIALEFSTPDGIEYVLPSQINSQLIEIPPPQQPSVDLLATSGTLTSTTKVKDDDDDGVQYLRPTENIGEYEVIGPEDSSLLANPEGVLQQLKPLFEESEAVTVEQSHLTALMTVLQTAGYELQTDEEDSQAQQIILNNVDDSIMVDNQHIQMVVSDDQELNTVNVSSMTVEEVDTTRLSFGSENSQ